MQNIVHWLLLLFLISNESSQKPCEKGSVVTLNIAKRAMIQAVTFGSSTAARPFAARLKSANDELICTSTIIHKSWALTAAHCVNGIDGTLKPWRAIFRMPDLCCAGF